MPGRRQPLREAETIANGAIEAIASLGVVLRRYAAALQRGLDARVPSVGYGRDLLVVSFHSRQIDGGPFFKVPIAFDALGVSKGLAVGLINFVDARHDRLKIGDILFRRL